MSWTQTYNPTGYLPLSAIAAALPVVTLLCLLAFFRFKAHTAALAALIVSLLVVIFIYGMPVSLAAASVINGAAFGLFPIGWIVISAIFVYDITIETGKFEIVKDSIASLSDDRRLQALLIAFSFGAFIEGAAGFGTPVAISAAMLIGLGFKPLTAAGIALIGNTAPVAFGSLGTPIIALAQVTGLPVEGLSAMVGRQLPIFSLIVPFWLVAAMAGLKGMRQVWPACLAVGGSFSFVQLMVSNLHGPWLVDIAASTCSIFSLIVLLKFWQPETIWRFPPERELNEAPEGIGKMHIPENILQKEPVASVRPERPQREIAIAWMPWAVLSLLIFFWGLPQVKAYLNHLSSYEIVVPYLHRMIVRVPPVVPQPKIEDAIFTLNWLSATGTGLFLSGMISGLLLGLRPHKLWRILGHTLRRVRWSLLTIAAMLALGFNTRYAGVDATLGMALASTGFLFPFFSPLLGWLGVALTGSDTSSNVLFGNLQQITATQLHLPPLLTAAANSSGGVMGKMIDAQSIVVAGVATGQDGGEGQILRYVFFHSAALAVLVGLLVLIQAYIFPWVVPR